MNIINKAKNIISKAGNLFKSKSYSGLFQSKNLRNELPESKGSFLDRNKKSLYLNKATKKRAEKVAQTEWYLKRGDTIIDDPKNEWIQLLKKPNQFYTGREFFELYQRYKDITGEAYIWIEKEGEKPVSLHLLRPDLVNIKIDEGDIVKYKYAQPDGGTKEFDPEEIIYSFHPDPQNPLRGESIIRSGLRVVETQIQIDEYQENILENGGKVEGVFNFSTPRLTKEQLEELKANYQEQYGEAKKSGIPLFLGGDIDYKKLGLSPEEMDYLETKRMTLNDIVIMTGVPKILLGSVENVKYSNAEESNRIFVKDTILPLVENLCNKLNQDLIPEEFELGFVDPTPQNKEEIRKDVEVGYESRTLTVNERREMLGKEPIEGGDQIYGGMNEIPLLSSDGKSFKGVKKKGINDKSPACRLKDETVEECKERKIPEIIEEGYPQDQAVAMADRMCQVECSEKVNHPLRDKAMRKKYGQWKDKKLTAEENKVEEKMKDYFQDQKERILESVEASNNVSKLEAVFNTEQEQKKAQEVIKPLLSSVVVNAGEDTIDFSRSFVTKAPDEFILSTEIRTWLSQRSELFAKEITETTFKKLKEVFAESYKADDPQKALVKGIEETYEGFNENRAKAIARTETHGSFQYGTYAGYKQSGVPIKIWISVMDSSTRGSHLALDGEEVPMNQTFSNGLRFPGDPAGAPSQVVNCRCSI